MHEYEGPSAFGRVFVLKEILYETKEFTEPHIKLVSFLFNDLMRFRSLQSNNLKMLRGRKLLLEAQF